MMRTRDCVDTRRRYTVAVVRGVRPRFTQALWPAANAASERLRPPRVLGPVDSPP